jgi:hypothetical protein
MANKGAVMQFKDVRITVYRLNEIAYNSLPFPEEHARGTDTSWKAFDNVVFFKPTHDQAFDEKPTCNLSFTAYKGDEGDNLVVRF